MSGADLKRVRKTLGDVISDRLSYQDMAALCGLSDPAGNGKDTYRKWEDGPGPSGPVATLLALMMDGLLDHDQVREFMIRKIERAIGSDPSQASPTGV